MDNSSTLDIPSPRRANPHHSMFLVTAGFVLFIGLISNLVPIVAAISYRSLKTRACLLVVNLSLCDIAVILSTLPFIIIVNIYDELRRDGTVCVVVGFAEILFTTASNLALAVISYDRYRSLSRPRRISIEVQRTGVVKPLLICLTLGFLNAIIPISEESGYSFNDVTGTCMTSWSTISTYAAVTIQLIRFGVPLTVITYSCVNIYHITKRLEIKVSPVTFRQRKRKRTQETKHENSTEVTRNTELCVSLSMRSLSSEDILPVIDVELSSGTKRVADASDQNNNACVSEVPRRRAPGNSKMTSFATDESQTSISNNACVSEVPHRRAKRNSKMTSVARDESQTSSNSLTTVDVHYQHSAQGERRENVRNKNGLPATINPTQMGDDGEVVSPPSEAMETVGCLRVNSDTRIANNTVTTVGSEEQHRIPGTVTKRVAAEEDVLVRSIDMVQSGAVEKNPPSSCNSINAAGRTDGIRSSNFGRGEEVEGERPAPIRAPITVVVENDSPVLRIDATQTVEEKVNTSSTINVTESVDGLCVEAVGTTCYMGEIVGVKKELDPRNSTEQVRIKENFQGTRKPATTVVGQNERTPTTNAADNDGILLDASNMAKTLDVKGDFLLASSTPMNSVTERMDTVNLGPSVPYDMTSSMKDEVQDRRQLRDAGTTPLHPMTRRIHHTTVTKGLVVLYGVFLVCWMPYATLIFAMRFVNDTSPVLAGLLYLLAISNSLMNAFLYSVTNVRFKKVIISCIRKAFRWSPNARENFHSRVRQTGVVTVSMAVRLH